MGELLDGSPNNRVLIVDDNEAIHEDFRKILAPPRSATAVTVDALAQAVFDDGASPSEAGPTHTFELTHATQGKDAYDLACKAVAAGQPYAVAFVDVRMPPGWNGLETVERIWQTDREIEVVLCTAYSDFSWEEISRRLSHPDRLVILRKPFDAIEVRQLAHCLTAKWFLRRQARCRMQDLEIMVEERAQELAEARERLRVVTTQAQLMR